jgi:hypothetical protein
MRRRLQRRLSKEYSREDQVKKTPVEGRVGMTPVKGQAEDLWQRPRLSGCPREPTQSSARGQGN